MEGAGRGGRVHRFRELLGYFMKLYARIHDRSCINLKEFSAVYT